MNKNNENFACSGIILLMAENQTQAVNPYNECGSSPLPALCSLTPTGDSGFGHLSATYTQKS